MIIDKIELGKRLKHFSEEVGGVKKLAELLGISQPNLSGSYISGKSVPGGEMIAHLMELGCNIGWLFTGQGNVKTIAQGNSIINESPIQGNGNIVSNTLIMNNTFESEMLREKVKFLEDNIKFLEDGTNFLKDLITDLRKQNNFLLSQLTKNDS